MKSFFDEEFRHTHQATVLGIEASNHLRPIFVRYMEQGYSPREISFLLQSEVGLIESDLVLERSAQKIRARRENLPDLNDEEKALAQTDRLEAVRLYRSRTNAFLKNALDKVDAYIQSLED